MLTLFVIGVGAGARAGIGAGTGTAGRSKCVSLSLGLYVDSAGCIFAIKLEVNMSVILALVGVWHPDCGRGSDNSSPAIAAARYKCHCRNRWDGDEEKDDNNVPGAGLAPTLLFMRVSPFAVSIRLFSILVTTSETGTRRICSGIHLHFNR